MGIRNHILAVVILSIFASCFGCAVSHPKPTGESLRPGFHVVHRPVYQPERAWNDLVAAYNTHDRFDRIWLAMKQDYLAHSIFNVRNIHFADSSVDFTYVQVESGNDVGGKKTFSLYNYQLLKADIAVELAREGGIDQYAIIIPNVIAVRTRTFDTAAKLADLFMFKQVQLKNYVKAISAQLAEFETFAGHYRALAVKPPVLEEQRRFIVMANALTQQKNYLEAIEQYQKAIKLNPTSYPAAYFNLALLLAQENRPIAAVFNMKRYLMLVPDAKDARAAQDKIYAWEAMLENVAKQ